MKRLHLISKPTRVNELGSWEEMYDDISSDWQHKAERLQVRRWRKLKRQMI